MNAAPPLVISTDRREVYLREEVWELSRVNSSRTTMNILDRDMRVGSIHLFPFGEDNLASVSYEVDSEHRGKGYAPLALRAISAYGKEQRGFTAMKIPIKESNYASQRVAVKEGFEIVGHEGEYIVFYRRLT